MANINKNKLIIRIPFLLCILVTLCWLMVLSHTLCNRFEKAITDIRMVEHELSQQIAMLNQSVAIRSLQMRKFDKSAEHHILVLGNSITKHPIKESIGWNSDWGMAASREENDFCHQLQSMLRECNEKTDITPVNAAFWEVDIAAIDSISTICGGGYDAIIIRLGENVKDVSSFNDAMIELIKCCQQSASYVCVTGCFWQDMEKEKAIVNAAFECDVPYIPIFWISSLYQDICYPHEGDTLTDVNGKKYPIVGNFITTHPNDLGMEYIAKTIYKNL